MLLQILVVSDPRIATEVLQMPKVMDKNKQALVTLDTVSLVHFHCWPSRFKRKPTRACAHMTADKSARRAS